MPSVEQEIDAFIRFLATERGLSENYQLSTRRSLSEFANWSAKAREITSVRDVSLPLITDYLANLKKGGLAAWAVRVVVVVLKILCRLVLVIGRVGIGAITNDDLRSSAG